MSDLKPGLELDALIAEKVMGWELNKKRTLFRNKKTHPFYDQFLHVPDSGGFRGDDGEKGWNPSTDIAAAWEVVEHLRNNHWRDVLNLFSPEIEGAKPWRAYFSKKFACVDDEQFESGESAPHAICLAALKSVEWPKV